MPIGDLDLFAFAATTVQCCCFSYVCVTTFFRLHSFAKLPHHETNAFLLNNPQWQCDLGPEGICTNRSTSHLLCLLGMDMLQPECRRSWQSISHTNRSNDQRR